MFHVDGAAVDQTQNKRRVFRKVKNALIAKRTLLKIKIYFILSI